MCLPEPYECAGPKDFGDRGAHYLCCTGRPLISDSVWSGAAHEETGLQWNGTDFSLATNSDSISAVMTIVFVCGDPVGNALILIFLYSDASLPQLV
ncbi:hypothetical protein TNCV_1595041 [Trichonephila clavipes]|nr:hypothetical protein TNCV_1595041 [Trichonephila clavipes]